VKERNGESAAEEVELVQRSLCGSRGTCPRELDLGRASGGGGGGPNDPDEPPPDFEHGEDVDLEEEPVSAVPRRYKVIFHNDDYTTMEFVIEVLKRFFHKTDPEATHVMLTVHKMGAAVAGVYTRDVAETKAQEVMSYARENGMPLLLTTEAE
jgi:ATP-dependent Clp protease adaptor protein ClpS